MKRTLIVMSLIVVMLGSTTTLAQAYEVTHYNKYSAVMVGPSYTTDWGTALQWLSNNTYYKGRIWASSPVYDREVRYRQQMFDHRDSYYWCGSGDNKIYQQVMEVQQALYWLGDNPSSNLLRHLGVYDLQCRKRFSGPCRS